MALPPPTKTTPQQPPSKGVGPTKSDRGVQKTTIKDPCHRKARSTYARSGTHLHPTSVLRAEYAMKLTRLHFMQDYACSSTPPPPPNSFSVNNLKILSKQKKCVLISSNLFGRLACSYRT